MRFVTVYIAEISIPWFKKKKDEQYKEFMLKYCVGEIRNCILITNALENMYKNEHLAISN